MQKTDSKRDSRLQAWLQRERGCRAQSSQGVQRREGRLRGGVLNSLVQ